MNKDVINGLIDNKETKIEVIFNEKEGYVTFIFDNNKKTDVRFKWYDIERLRFELNKKMKKEI